MKAEGKIRTGLYSIPGLGWGFMNFGIGVGEKKKEIDNFSLKPGL